MRFRDLRWLSFVILPYLLLVVALAAMVFPEMPAVQVLFDGWADTNFFRIAIQLFLFVAPIFAVGYIASYLSGRRALALIHRYGKRTRWFLTAVSLGLLVVVAYIVLIWTLAMLLDVVRGSRLPLPQAALSLAHTGTFLLLCAMVAMQLQLYTGNMRLSLAVAYAMSLSTELPLQVLPIYARLPIHYPMLIRSAMMKQGGYAEPVGLYIMFATLLVIIFVGWCLRRNTAMKET